MTDKEVVVLSRSGEYDVEAQHFVTTDEISRVFFRVGDVQFLATQLNDGTLRITSTTGALVFSPKDMTTVEITHPGKKREVT